MRNLYLELRKFFSSCGFYICILFSLILFFFADIYTDQMTRNIYTVIRAFMDIDADEMLNIPELCNTSVMSNAQNGWIMLFLPIICSFCFVPLICGERESGAIRYNIFRTSKLKFSLSRYFSGVICGGFAVSLGYAIFCGIVYFLFPSAANYPDTTSTMNADFNFFLAVLGIFFTATFWSMPAMLLTSFLRNKYLIMCIPLFIKYGIQQFVLEEAQKAMADIENIDMNAINFLSNISPDALASIYINPDWIWTALYFGTFSAVFLIIYIIAEKKRGDCGA